MTKEELQKLHFLELKIAKNVKKVCEELNINYFLIAGSFLGAVRHKGFIPWDDDMDIGMLRKDYDRFLKQAPLLLGDEFFLQNWDSDPNFPFSFAKVRLKGTVIEEKMNIGVATHKGVFLDIFPFDNVPGNKFLQIKQSYWMFIIKKLLWIKKGYGKELKKTSVRHWVKYTIAYTISQLFSYEKLKNKYYYEMIRYNSFDSEYVFCSCPYSYKKSIVKREYLQNLKPYIFENIYLNGPIDYDSYLSYLFGDYMKLPPENKRHTHDIQKLFIGTNTGDMCE